MNPPATDAAAPGLPLASEPAPALAAAAASTPRVLTCRWCGLDHRRPALRRGERATCARCDGLLAKRGRFHFQGRAASLAFTLAGFALAIPAMVAPLVTVDKLRGERVAFLFSGAEALWSHDMKLLAVWVTLCGIVAPVVLLATLIGLLAPSRHPRPAGRGVVLRTAHAVEEWAMPEVYVLAVLVALTKLGTLVNVTVGAGLWCYAAMAMLILLAWRSFDFGSAADEEEPARAPSP